MELAIITAQQVFILFLMILTGAIGFRTGIIKEDGKKVLSDMLLYLIAPAMLIDSYMVEFDPATFQNLLTTFVLSGILLLLGLAVSFACTWKLKSPNIIILRFACTFSNAGYMGFPLIRALFGEEGILYASAFLAMFNLLLWAQGYVMVSGKVRPREIAVSIITCPSIIAVIIGLGIYLMRIPVSDIIKTPVSMIGDMNTPMSMIVISRSFFADSSYMLSFSVLCSCVCSRLISPSVSSWHKQDNTLMHQSPGHIQRRTPYNF